MKLVEQSPNIFTVEAFLSAKKCGKFISQSEYHGFKPENVKIIVLLSFFAPPLMQSLIN